MMVLVATLLMAASGALAVRLSERSCRILRRVFLPPRLRSAGQVLTAAFAVGSLITCVSAWGLSVGLILFAMLAAAAYGSTVLLVSR